jgi:cytoskeletal protein CcmA (bactofilin family)
MVFRKEKGNDVFHRQFSALRHQLGGQPEEHEDSNEAESQPESSQPDVSAADAPQESEYSYQAPYQESRPNAGMNISGNYEATALEQYSGVPTSPPDVQTSVIAHDTVWQGDLTTNGSLHVHGMVQGTLEAIDTVFIAEEADVDATITARHVIVSGFVKGAIRCSSRFEALAAGRILADVVAPSIVIHEGAVIRGEFRMEKQSPADEKTSPAYRRAGRNR